MEKAPEMDIQISILVDPTNPQAIIRDAEQIFRYSYRNADFNHVNNAFLLTKFLSRVSGRTKEHFQTRYSVARDLYHEAIANQMDYLRSVVADGSNFTKKLRRTQGLGRDRENKDDCPFEAYGEESANHPL